MAHKVMEVEKFHNLPPANWRTRKNSDIILSKSERLKTMTYDVHGQEMMDIPGQEEIVDSAFLCFLFY